MVVILTLVTNRAHGKHARYGLCGPATRHRRNQLQFDEETDYRLYYALRGYPKVNMRNVVRAMHSLKRVTELWMTTAAAHVPHGRGKKGALREAAVASGWRAAGADDMAWMSRIASDTRPRVCDTTLSRVREMASVTPGDIARGRSTPSAPGPDLASGPRCTAPMAGDGVRAGDERCGEMPSRCWICARIRAVLLASGSSVDTNAVPPDVAGCLPGVRRPWLSSSRW